MPAFEIPILIVQFPVSLSVAENLSALELAIEHARPGELVLCPEGCVSGYSTDLAFLQHIDSEAVEQALSDLRQQARQGGIHLWVGAVVKEQGVWRNAAFGFTPQGQVHRYDKVNLASHERGTFQAGSELPVFTLEFEAGTVLVGVQICRELRYPEQWGWLARQGVKVFLHLNNAVHNARYRSVWRSMLVSRAAETGRFVLSANNGAQGRMGPTVAVAPDGGLLGEIAHRGAASLRLSIDLSQVSNWYLDQSRTDLVTINPTNDRLRSGN